MYKLNIKEWVGFELEKESILGKWTAWAKASFSCTYTMIEVKSQMPLKQIQTRCIQCILKPIQSYTGTQI